MCVCVGGGGEGGGGEGEGKGGRVGTKYKKGKGLLERFKPSPQYDIERLKEATLLEVLNYLGAQFERGYLSPSTLPCPL